jgi:tyrosine phenol-lyase
MTYPKPSRRSWAEPWKIKMVEPIRMTTLAERQKFIAEAGYNTFLLRSEDVYIDLLTDSGTNAMSDRQWAGMMLGDEAYAGSRNFYNLGHAVTQHYGYKYLVPTHQGRGAEHILSQVMIHPGDIIPGNMYFTTTRLHQELAGGRFVDVIVDEAHDPANPLPFKGNVDLAKLESVIRDAGPRKIPYVCIAGTVNMAGGQPQSMQNMRAVAGLCKSFDIPVVLDATRAIENAYFIQQREPGYQSKKVAEILMEYCSHTSTCTMSAKKDALVYIGGWLATNDQGLFEEARNLVVVYEGLHTYGGLAGRDMSSALASARWNTSAITCSTGASPSSNPSAGTRFSWTQRRSTRISHSRSIPPRRWPGISTLTREFAPWSAALSPPDAMP